MLYSVTIINWILEGLLRAFLTQAGGAENYPLSETIAFLVVPARNEARDPRKITCQGLAMMMNAIKISYSRTD